MPHGKNKKVNIQKQVHALSPCIIHLIVISEKDREQVSLLHVRFFHPIRSGRLRRNETYSYLRGKKIVCHMWSRGKEKEEEEEEEKKTTEEANSLIPMNLERLLYRKEIHKWGP